MTKRVTRQALQVLSLHPDLQRVEPLDLQITLPPFVRANWRTGCSVETEWLTDISHGRETLVEDRRGGRIRPVRSFEATITGLRIEDAHEVSEYAMTVCQDRNAMPIYSDRTAVGVTASSGATVLECSTDYRRMYAGQRVAIVPIDFSTFEFDGILGRAMYAEIESVQSDRLTLASALQVDVPAGSYVYPMVDAQIELATQIDVVGAQTVEILLRYTEISGMSALPSSWVGPLSPFFPLNDLDSRAIVSLRGNTDSDPESVTIAREGAVLQSGRDATAYGAGSRARHLFSFGHLAKTREQAWSIIRLFDSCRGRVGTFWYVNPQTLWSAPFGLTSLDYIDVSPYGYASNVTRYWPNVSIELLDGSMYARQIESVSEVTVGGVDVHRITFSDPLPSSASSRLERVTSAHLSRFTTDANRENWITDEACLFHLDMTEVLDETAVVFTGV